MERASRMSSRDFIPSRKQISRRTKLRRLGNRDDLVLSRASAPAAVGQLQHLSVLCLQNAHASTFSGLSMRISDSAVTKFPAQR